MALFTHTCSIFSQSSVRIRLSSYSTYLVRHVSDRCSPTDCIGRTPDEPDTLQYWHARVPLGDLVLSIRGQLDRRSSQFCGRPHQHPFTEGWRALSLTKLNPLTRTLGRVGEEVWKPFAVIGDSQLILRQVRQKMLASPAVLKVTPRNALRQKGKRTVPRQRPALVVACLG
jgi:hypothetical protein